MENTTEEITSSEIEKDDHQVESTPESVPETTEKLPEPAVKRRRRKNTDAPAQVPEGRCPACFFGQDASKGEGTHLLNTVEHPYVPPTLALEKPAKQPRRPMAKELRGAANFAEKMLPKKIAEKAKLQGELVRVEAEIQEYTRVLQALGGQMPVGLPPVPQYAHQPVTMAAVMSDAPLYPQAARQPNIATVPPMPRASGGAMDVPLVEDGPDEDAFLTERSALTGGTGWV